MSTDERDAMHIAQHKICLLAPAMRDCAHCAFNIGFVADIDAVLKIGSDSVLPWQIEQDSDAREWMQMTEELRHYG